MEICLPSTLQEIQAEAFKSCLALASIDLPDKLRYIAHKAFGDVDGCHISTIGELREPLGDDHMPRAMSLNRAFDWTSPGGSIISPLMGTTGQCHQATKHDL